MFYIYKITNILSNKSYVGQTTDYKTRWKQKYYQFCYDKSSSSKLRTEIEEKYL